ncbi:MAG: TlpA disulfide reductase family protein [Cyclobacteriaceae bacterium]
MIKQLFIKYILASCSFGIILYCNAQSEENAADKESLKEEMFSNLQEFYESNKDTEGFSLTFYQKIDELVTTFPNDEFVAEVFSEVIMDPIFTYNQVISTFRKIDTTSIDPDDLEEIKKSIRKMEKFQKGKSLYVFQAVDSLGQTKSTEDYRGDILLVEFWASWCGPCKEEHPELNEIYEKYQTKGFEVFGVSIDENETAWKRAIARDDLRWINTIIPEGFKSDIAQKLLIQYVPSNFLIDREGKLIAYNIKPNKLSAILEQELNY